MPSFLHTPDKHRIAYEMSDGRGPTLIWCGGLKSDMEGFALIILDMGKAAAHSRMVPCRAGHLILNLFANSFAVVPLF